MLMMAELTHVHDATGFCSELPPYEPVLDIHEVSHLDM